MGPNHSLTYSSTGYSSPGLINPYSNFDKMIERINNGDNVAFVVNQKNAKPKKLEYKGKTYPVSDFDAHDYRPADKTPDGQPGVFGALGKKEQGKGTGADKARNKSGGFYFDYFPERDGDTVRVPDQDEFKAAEKAERIRRNKRKDGGGIPVDHETFHSQYHNHHHFEDAKPGTRKIGNWWDYMESKRKAG